MCEHSSSFEYHNSNPLILCVHLSVEHQQKCTNGCIFAWMFCLTKHSLVLIALSISLPGTKSNNNINTSRRLTRRRQAMLSPPRRTRQRSPSSPRCATSTRVPAPARSRASSRSPRAPATMSPSGSQVQYCYYLNSQKIY